MSTVANINEYRNGTVRIVLTIRIGTEADRYYYHGMRYRERAASGAYVASRRA